MTLELNRYTKSGLNDKSLFCNEGVAALNWLVSEFLEVNSGTLTSPCLSFFFCSVICISLHFLSVCVRECVPESAVLALVQTVESAVESSDLTVRD